MNTTVLTETEACVAHLLELADFDSDSFALTPLPGGRNNRVFRVQSAVGFHLMKQYFHHPQDPRDRLAHESAFLHHLELSGCTVAPHLFASIPADHTALLEFVEGETLSLAQIDAEGVDQAAEFFLRANTDRTGSSARLIPSASEACFSIAEHLATAQRRVDRLAQILLNDEVDVAADLFARKDIIEVWRMVRANVLAEWPQRTEREAFLPRNERCLSPSDFGFHNALRETGGRIRFLDFEYAGWDDPAKLICDFANQPDMPLPPALSSRFADVVIAAHHNPGELSRRVAALRPLYQVKWACICLNDFLDTGRQRHDFTQGCMTDNRPRRELQLRRARQMLARATSV
jgi:hypothetical protein